MIYKIKPDGTREIVAPDGEIVEIPESPSSMIQSNGPIIPINISLPKSEIERFSLTEKHSAFTYAALIDTGSSISAITPKIAYELNLLIVGYSDIISVHSVEERPLETHIVSCDLQGVDCLIGRDVLRNWIMIYDGVNGEITICD